MLDLGTADSVFHGEDYGIAGEAVLIPGDLDGDGFDDLVIGDRGTAQGAGEQSGQVYVVYGRESFASSEYLTEAISLHGHLRGEQVGEWLAAVGDVDSDGYADFLVSAGGIDSGGGYDDVDRGAAYLVYGGPERLLSGFLRDVGTRFEGVLSRSFTGRLLAGLGDLNNDGYRDFAIGSFGETEFGSGLLYVYYGRSRRFASVESVESADAVVVSDARLLWPVSIGDNDGDGDDEILVPVRQSPDGDAFYLIEGSKERLAGENDVRDIGRRVLQGMRAEPAASLGDLNHDGFPELSAGTVSGELVFFNGRQFEGIVDGAEADSRLALERSNWTGGGIDLDGDSCPDFFVSDQSYAEGNGAVHVFSGGCDDMSGALDLARSVTWAGRSYGGPSAEEGVLRDAVGFGVAVGDVNGDTVGDLLIGAVGTRVGDVSGGNVYLVLGRRP